METQDELEETQNILEQTKNKLKETLQKLEAFRSMLFMKSCAFSRTTFATTFSKSTAVTGKCKETSWTAWRAAVTGKSNETSRTAWRADRCRERLATPAREDKYVMRLS